MQGFCGINLGKPCSVRLSDLLGHTFVNLGSISMWKTVPTEPTAEMLSAGRNAPKESILIGDSCVMRPDKDAVLMSNLSSIWQAMVVVSPAYSSAGIACELALLAQTLEYSDGARTTIAIGSA